MSKNPYLTLSAETQNTVFNKVDVDDAKEELETSKKVNAELEKHIALIKQKNRILEEQNAVLNQMNKTLQDEQKNQIDLVMNQAANIDLEYTRLSGILYEYGVNATRLRNERAGLKYSLDTARKFAEMEAASMKLEYEAKIVELKEAYIKLREDSKAKIPGGTEGDDTVQYKEKPHKEECEDGMVGTGQDIDAGAKCLLPNQESLIDMVDEKLLNQASLIDTSDEKFQRLEVDVPFLRTGNEHNTTKPNSGIGHMPHICPELAYSDAQTLRLRSEVIDLAARLSLMSSNALVTFQSLFEKAVATTRRNFGKIVLTMDEQLAEDEVDKETAARIVSFSRRVCESGHWPLSRLERDVQELVESTYGHFRDIQKSLNDVAIQYKDIQTRDIPQVSHHNSVYLSCLYSENENKLREYAATYGAPGSGSVTEVPDDDFVALKDLDKVKKASCHRAQVELALASIEKASPRVSCISVVSGEQAPVEEWTEAIALESMVTLVK
ncbi:uncharacterized protein RSE6_01717 [Rhynchosporium secalis]|uniref:Uncharacterized protein n=1 Tax=Rhynchosporium secalis TaxID=38038 RepID=A0A1E1LYI0_RHYSE|nr:uncharacterized protein RSE6_01717 [Rhynchosporium secalis]